MTVRTSFDPLVHGFGFTNRFSGSDVIGELSRQGRFDELFGGSIAGPVRLALSAVSKADFWGVFGLCGGMSRAALDAFHAGEASSREPQPPRPGSELFSRLVDRQADSFEGTALVARLVAWLALPESNPWWAFWTDSVGKLVIEREWPDLRRSLDAGEPRALCLVRSRRLDQLSRNHQVVATGYSVSASGRVTVILYDPNHPGADPTISFDTGSFLHRLGASQSTGEPTVGWFTWPAAG